MNKIMIFIIGLLITSCASNETAVFVSSTSVSVLEADTKPAGISIGYKRVEGYLGPNRSDGEAPPVLSIIESDGEVFNPKVRQLYATGDAARIAVGEDVKDDPPSTKTPEIMFFGTSTNIGINLGTTGNVIDSFSFGYKRKELSVIPLLKEGDDSYYYPSVLATINTTGEVSSNSAGLETNQFFATGDTAKGLAKELGASYFKKKAERAMGDVQQVEAGAAIRCYAGVRLEDRVKVWNDANYHNLFFEEENEEGSLLAYLESTFHASVKDGVITDPDKLYQVDGTYADVVFLQDDGDENRLARLAEHRGFVCGLSRNNKG